MRKKTLSRAKGDKSEERERERERLIIDKKQISK
jgi:hypothetical protein